MLNRRENSECDKNSKICDSVSGFQFFQSAACGFSSCICRAAHYHCQMCGYGTSEVSHTRVHHESCSRVIRNHFSQSPCLPVSGNSQGTEHTFVASLDSSTDITLPTISSSVPSAMQITNSGNHLYYRNTSQQSSVFNPLLSSQSQTLYSGVFGSQVGFSGQNNYPPGFNGFTHVEPLPWLSESRMNSSTNSTPSLDVARSKPLSCNSQGMSHSCCGNRVGGLLENMGLCSPLATDSFKTLNKESASCQHKSALSMENQNWFCGQSMLGYSNQVAGQGIQNAVYKCSEPFPSCTMSQLGIPLNEQDLKHSTICYEPNGVSKAANAYHSTRKSSCLEINRDPFSKYSTTQKIQGHNSEQHPPCLQNKDQESSFDSHSVFASVDGDLQDEMYSQTSVAMQMAEDRNSYNPMAKNTLMSQTILCDPAKSSAHSSQPTTVFSRCNLANCDALDGYLQLEGQPLYQYPQAAPAVLNLDEDQVSNPGSCSGAAESDIVVEESEEEILECAVAVEDVKRESHSRCFVCGSSNARFMQLSANAPLTSTTHIPVVTKIALILPSSYTNALTFDTEVVCQRCLNLIDTVDCLESKLTSVKKSLIELYSERNLSITSNICKSGESDCSDNTTTEKSQDIVSDSVNETNVKTYVKTTDENPEESFQEDDHTIIVDEKTEMSLKVEERELKEVKGLRGGGKESETIGDLENKENFNCGICNLCFPSDTLLEKHSKEHAKRFNFFCDRCGEGFTQNTHLEEHLSTHSLEHRYQCEQCGKCFTKKNVLEDHLRKHKGAFSLSCSFCKKGFLYASSLQIHERTHTGERPFICQHCGKTFICLSNLTSHLQLCEGHKTFDCKQCDKVFTTSTQLKYHLVTSHELDPQHKCKECGKVFLKPCDLKVHNRVHSGEKPHKCSVCGKSYSSVGNLNQHAKKHCEEKPFKCHICGKGFLRKTVLERHQNQHSGERPYKCDHCEKSFASIHNLHSHTKLHNGTMKKYTCSVCGKTMNHGLKVHMRSHSGDKPYSCPECSSCFSVKSSLVKHIKLKHDRIT